MPLMGQKKMKPRLLTKVKAWAGDETRLAGGRLKVRVRCALNFVKLMEGMRRLYPAGIYKERIQQAL